MLPDELKMVRARKVVDNGTGPFAIPLAQLTESILLNEKLDQLLSKEAPEMPEYPEIEIPEFPSEITVANLPEIQKVEITNLPKDKDDKEQLKLLKQIAEELKKKEQYDYDIEIDATLKEQLKGEKGDNGSPDTAEQIADKLNTLEEKVELSVLKGWKDFIANLGEKTSATRVYGTRMLRNLVDVIGAKDATTGQVLTKQADGTFAFETPSGGGGGSVTVTASDTDPTGSANEGDVHLLTDDGTLSGVVVKTFVYDGAWIETTEPDYEKCKNVTGSTITKGKVVYVNGASGSNPTITLADNTTETTSSKTIGLVAKNITNNSDGYFIRSGLLIGVDTSTFSAGDTLWLGTSGNITNTRPSAPNHAVFVGYALTSASNGRILVSVMNGYELDELHNVSITTPSNGQVLTYDSATNLWKNQTPSGGSGYTETFETVSQNFNEYPYTIAYSGGEISTITYDLGGGQSIVKTFNYTSGNITSIVLSGDTPSGINLTKTFTYSSGNIVSVAYS